MFFCIMAALSKVAMAGPVDFRSRLYFQRKRCITQAYGFQESAASGKDAETRRKFSLRFTDAVGALSIVR